MSTAQLSTMASPDHKAGLAFVVPTSATENRSPIRVKVKQHAYTSPKKGSSQFNGHLSSRPSNSFLVPGHSNGSNTQRQPNGISPVLQPIRAKPNGNGHQPANGNLPASSRLLGVDEALQYSPFSSIVPFSSGKSSLSLVYGKKLMA